MVCTGWANVAAEKRRIAVKKRICFIIFSVCFRLKSEINMAYIKPDSDETYKIEDELEEWGNGGIVVVFAHLKLS